MCALVTGVQSCSLPIYRGRYGEKPLSGICGARDLRSSGSLPCPMVYIRPPRLYGEGDGEASGNPHCCRAIRIEETGIDHVKWLFGMQTVCQRQHGARDVCGMKASTQCRNDRKAGAKNGKTAPFLYLWQRCQGPISACA